MSENTEPTTASPVESDHAEGDVHCNEALEYVSQLIERMNTSETGMAPPRPAPSDAANKPSANPSTPTPPGGGSAAVLSSAKQSADADSGVSGLSTAWLAAQTKLNSPPDDATESTGSSLVTPQPEQTAAKSAKPRVRNRIVEKPANLEKLREAANLTSTSAISAFDCKSLVRQSYTYILLTVLAIVFSLTFASMATRMASAAYTASLGGLSFAIWCYWRFSQLSRKIAANLRALQAVGMAKEREETPATMTNTFGS